MKKYLVTGLAAVAISGMFTSCTHDNDSVGGSSDLGVVETYEKAFISRFGTPSPDADWGFGPSTTKAGTRTITVNGDAYDKFPSADDVAANFPTAIPNDAKTDAELEAEWKGKNAVDENGEEIIAWGNKVPMWDMYAIYLNMVGKVINNIKVTAPGEYSVGHSWANPADRVYNVYINIGNGNELTLKRNGAEHVNFYIMSGNVTIDSNFGECGGIISVAEDATVNDQRSHIAHNDGIKIYNKGTYNAQGSATIYNQELGKNVTSFDIGNHCTFYNEGKFTSVSELSYSPGDANTSYFMNLGDDAELTAPAMTLNSAGNFYNDGKVVIDGETNVTQKEIYWVNAGYYKTGSIVFSAQNATFYNYCQLIVTGNAHMYDGEFNLMPNSYTETATAEMDNFIVNMGGNAGINIKGAVRVIAQGDGTFQGFKNAGTNNYVLIGGKVTIDSHKKTFSVEPGITYSIKEIEIVRGGSVVTEAQLQEEKSGDYPVLDLQGTEVPFGELTVTPKEFGQGCGATWKVPGDDPSEDVVRVIAEDMGDQTTNESSDFDFNDVVFDVEYVSASEAKVTILAAGGTLPLTVGWNGDETNESGYIEYEVHNLLGYSETMIINTESKVGNHIDGVKPKKITVSGSFDKNNLADGANAIPVKVRKNNKWYTIVAPKGKAAGKLCVGTDYKWCIERQDIDSRWKDDNGGLFLQYSQDPVTLTKYWYRKAQ